jgi:hypothetical protein
VAATLDDAELRGSYLTGVRPNARSLALAKEWLGEGGAEGRGNRTIVH